MPTQTQVTLALTNSILCFFFFILFYFWQLEIRLCFCSHITRVSHTVCVSVGWGWGPYENPVHFVDEKGCERSRSLSKVND